MPNLINVATKRSHALKTDSGELGRAAETFPDQDRRSNTSLSITLRNDCRDRLTISSTPDRGVGEDDDDVDDDDVDEEDDANPGGDDKGTTPGTGAGGPLGGEV